MSNLIFSILILFQTLAMADKSPSGSEIVLDVLNRDILHKSIKYTGSSKSECKINDQKAEKKDCEAIYAQMEGMKKIDKYKDFKEVVFDDYQYVFEFNNKKYHVERVGTSECTYNYKGKVGCKENELDPFQKVLLVFTKFI